MSKYFYKIIYLSGLFWQAGMLSAQDSLPESFQEAKSLLQAKKYYQAEPLFRFLYTDGEKELQPMAGFYRGVCLFYQKAYAQASAHFAEVARAYPTFPLQEALLYWQGLSTIEAGRLKAGFGYLSALGSPRYLRKGAAYKAQYLKNLSSETQHLQSLAALYEAYPSDSLLGAYLQVALGLHIDQKEEKMTLDTLFKETWAKQNAAWLLDTAPQSKPYHIAVLLPFFFSDWKQTEPHMRRNSFVWSLYEGLCMAKNTLHEVGITIQLHPYDTRRDTEQTLEVLSQLQDKAVDLIIGPLYWETIMAAESFATEENIPMLNPLSSNPQLATAHNNVWLFQASDLTKVQAAAQYAEKQFRNTRVAIFCEQLPRSIATCETYAQQMQEKGFEIIFEYYLPEDSALIIRDSLTVVEKILLEDVPIDSIPEEEEGYILRKGFGRYGEQEESWYREHWRIQPDSIGHIFVAATHPSFLSYTLSAIEQRPDTIPILVDARWLHHREFDYSQLERLGVRFISSNYLHKDNLARQTFAQDFLRRWGEPPNVHAALGYELLWLMGKAMHRYGSQFMQYLQKSSYQEAHLGTLLRYVPAKRDNQIVELLQIQGGRLQRIYVYGKG